MAKRKSIVLYEKLLKVRKLIEMIEVDKTKPSANTSKRNAIIKLNDAIKDISQLYITEIKKENYVKQENNKKMGSIIYKTGYPCKPIQSRKQNSKGD